MTDIVFPACDHNGHNTLVDTETNAVFPIDILSTLTIKNPVDTETIAIKDKNEIFGFFSLKYDHYNANNDSIMSHILFIKLIYKLLRNPDLDKAIEELEANTDNEINMQIAACLKTKIALYNKIFTIQDNGLIQFNIEKLQEIVGPFSSEFAKSNHKNHFTTWNLNLRAIHYITQHNDLERAPNSLGSSDFKLYCAINTFNSQKSEIAMDKIAELHQYYIDSKFIAIAPPGTEEASDIEKSTLEQSYANDNNKSIKARAQSTSEAKLTSISNKRIATTTIFCIIGAPLFAIGLTACLKDDAIPVSKGSSYAMITVGAIGLLIGVLMVASIIHTTITNATVDPLQAQPEMVAGHSLKW